MSDTHEAIERLEQQANEIGQMAAEPASLRPPDVWTEGTVEARAKLWAEFAAAKAEFTKILKDTEGQKGNQRFRYANLAAITAATDPALAKHGICITDIPTCQPGSNVTCYTTIIAGHGAEIWSRYFFARPKWGDPYKHGPFSVQDYGGLLTYFRRYVRQAVLGVEGDKDLDDPPPRDTQRETTRETPRSTPQTSQPKDPPKRRQQHREPASNKPTEEDIAIVLRALADCNTVSTVADVQSKTSPPMVEGKVAMALTIAAKNGDCILVKKGGISCYLARDKQADKNWQDDKEHEPADATAPDIGGGDSSKPEPEAEPATNDQRERIFELYKMLFDYQKVMSEAPSQPLGVKKFKELMRNDCYAKLSLHPDEIDVEAGDKLIELLEAEVG